MRREWIVVMQGPLYASSPALRERRKSGPAVFEGEDHESSALERRVLNHAAERGQFAITQARRVCDAHAQPFSARDMCTARRVPKVW